MLSRVLLLIAFVSPHSYGQQDFGSSISTKYSAQLYVTQTTSQEGKIEEAASHGVINGPGELVWSAGHLAGGEYLAFIEYSSDTAEVDVELESGESVLVDTLEVTSRVYPQTDLWYQRSFARKKLAGSLMLSEGRREVRLRTVSETPDNTLAIRSLELLPEHKTADARAEIARAEASRPTADWFSDMSYGLMFHWTSQAAPRSSASKDYATAVRDFDVQKFVRMVAATGADYVIFTANHATPHFPAPLDQWEKFHPGQTTQRDLIREIADGLSQNEITLILYFATHIYADLDDTDNKSFVNANVQLLTEVGERYGKSVAGYWLDGWYQSAERFVDLPYEQIYHASKAGNADRLLALNSWIYPIVTPWQDYWAGEIYSIPVPPSARIIEDGPGAGLQYHALLALEGGWVHTQLDTAIPAPVLETNELIDFIDACAGKGPVTLNVMIYQDGTISEQSLDVLTKIREHLAVAPR